LIKYIKKGSLEISELPVLRRGCAVPKGLVGVAPTLFNTLVLNSVERRAPLSDIVIRWKRRENTSGGRPCVSQALPGRCDEDKNFRSRRKTNTGSPVF